MVSLNKTICRGLLQAAIIVFSSANVDSFSTIDRHSHQCSFRLPSSLSSADNDHQKNEVREAIYRCDESSSGNVSSSVGDTTRRRSVFLLFHSMLIGGLSWQSCDQIAHSEGGLGENDETVFLSGKVTLPSGMTDPGGLDEGGDGEKRPTPSALYVTARPDRPDNVPKAILDGSRGKPPPILAARFESPVFPFEFKLGEKDLTPEGVGGIGNGEQQSSNPRWWAGDDLIVSARWDSDGVAATRSPEDLVGRNLWKRGTAATSPNDGISGFVLGLQGRGSFGKFATKKS
mmetsp:Transcript_26472/g.58290  ORF Transcript_26472/g.58290 Transcript_26472/m.58290 type:complete len:288 (+) Transcript_26472:79-942(+)